YHVPVCADVPDIDVIFVKERDEVVNPLGAKGLGELGVVGVAAAISNAVYYATGKRIRDLPITLDKLLRGDAAGGHPRRTPHPSRPRATKAVPSPDGRTAGPPT